MNKKAYFVYKDPNASSRGSDGVELCVIPKLYDNKIYFYCAEYMSFWDSIEDVGNSDKAIEFHSNLNTEPARLVDICNQNLCQYITLIKEVHIVNPMEINYIHFE